MRFIMVVVLVMLVLTTTSSFATSRNLIENNKDDSKVFSQGESRSVDNHHYIPRQEFNNGDGGVNPIGTRT
ncbi:hypothetical protein MTR67_049441 [Solanum verrucosum]|uniref:Uncharacterized protein n=1 Tax=Solanum verrucosum TaxID=315347 RepID=A0AAF0ZYB2_SOLVR|nr:hypothetical protein MTR67_049441 [Solanum verrucosum]